MQLLKRLLTEVEAYPEETAGPEEDADSEEAAEAGEDVVSEDDAEPEKDADHSKAGEPEIDADAKEAAELSPVSTLEAGTSGDNVAEASQARDDKDSGENEPTQSNDEEEGKVDEEDASLENKGEIWK